MKNGLKMLGLAAAAALMCMTMRASAVAQDGMSTGSGAGQGMSRGMKVSSADQKFMMTAAAGGMAEVEMARLALEKSSSDGRWIPTPPISICAIHTSSFSLNQFRHQRGHFR